jgi:hypothetical protein
MLIALGFGLASLCVGCLLGSSINLSFRVLLFAIWLVPVAFVAFGLSGRIFVGDLGFYGLLPGQLGC